MQRLPNTHFKKGYCIHCVVCGKGELLLLRLVMSSYFRFISTLILVFYGEKVFNSEVVFFLCWHTYCKKKLCMKMFIIFVNWEIEFLVNYHLQAENQYFTNKTAVGIRIAIYINDQCVTYVGPENLGYPIVSTPQIRHMTCIVVLIRWRVFAPFVKVF